jgi:hypothetical protein
MKWTKSCWTIWDGQKQEGKVREGAGRVKAHLFIGGILRQTPPNKKHLNTEGQKSKLGHVKESVLMGRGRSMKRVQEVNMVNVLYIHS